LAPFGSGDTLDLNFWTRTVAPWEQQNNAKVNFEIIGWGQLNEKVLAAYSSGAGPELCYALPDCVADYVKLGIPEPLDSYFTQAEKDNFIYWDQGTVNGKQYVLPWIVGNARIMYFNMDLFAKAGVTSVPKTWNDFIAVGQKLVATYEGTDVMPFWQEWDSSTNALGSLSKIFLPFLFQAGATDYVGDNGQPTLLDGDAGLRAAQYLYDLKHKYNIISDESFTLPFAQGPVLFAQQKIACMINDTSIATSQLKDASFKWDFIFSLEDKNQGTWFAVDSLMVSAKASNKPLAVSLMKFLASPSVKEAFHRELMTFAPISKGEAYLDDPRFADYYSEKYSAILHTSQRMNSQPIAADLFKNLQLMMLGNLTPRESLQRTVDYSKTL
jgi:multiple sugar transport system substrate-binding protein